jgi:hypothetical protein
LVRTIKGQWITRPPARCPNGHPLGPNQVLVGHQACLGHGGGHTTWTCRHATRRCTGRCSTPQHCGCCDFTASPPFGGSRGGRNYSRRLQKRGPYEIWDSKLSSFIQTGGPYANRAAGQGCDRPEECFTSEDDDHEVALSAQKSGMRTSWGHRLFLLR